MTMREQTYRGWVITSGPLGVTGLYAAEATNGGCCNASGQYKGRDAESKAIAEVKRQIDHDLARDAAAFQLTVAATWNRTQ